MHWLIFAAAVGYLWGDMPGAALAVVLSYVVAFFIALTRW